MERLDLGSLSFVSYSRDGLSVDGLSWCPLSFDQNSGVGTYVLRYDAGCRTPIHMHGGTEEFIVLEGELEDRPSGSVFGRGCYGRFGKGTSHYTRTELGCVVFVISGGPNRVLGRL